MQKSLNDLSSEDFEEIKKMASVFFSPKEIALCMELAISEFVEECNTQETACFNAYQGGLLLSEYEVRLSIVKFAKAGSTPAQTMSMDMLNKVKLKMNDV